VLVLECGGEIACDSDRLLSSTQNNALRVFDGELQGKTIRFGAGKKENAYIEQWSKVGDSIAWPVRVRRPGTFDVAATYDADAASAGGKYTVAFGGRKLSAEVKAGKEIEQKLGRIGLEAGTSLIQVAPDQIAGSELMRLRTLTLTPVVK
jgi:hypothetical protein